MGVSNSDCAWAEELVSARLDGELGDGEAACLDAHLARCRECRRRAAELERLHRVVRVRPAEHVPDLTRAILAGVPPVRRRPAVAIAAAVLLVAGSAVALGVALTGTRPSPALAADGAVTPEPLGSSGVVYLDLSNTGGDDALVGASTDVAAAVELHAAATDDGRVLMQAIDRLDCSPGLVQDVATSHLMLRGLRRPLSPGERFSLELTFERSGTLAVAVEVVGWDELPDHLDRR